VNFPPAPVRILRDYTVAPLPSYKCCPLKGDRLLVTTWAIVPLVKHPSVTLCTGPLAGRTKHLPRPPGALLPIQSKQTPGNGQTGKLDKYIHGGKGPHHPISEPGQNNPTLETPRTIARITRKPPHNHLHGWLQTRQWVNWMWLGNLSLR